MFVRLKNKMFFTLFSVTGILLISLFCVCFNSYIQAFGIEETATSNVTLQWSDEPVPPEPVPVPTPDDPGGFIGNVLTGDPLTISVLALCVVAMISMAVFLIWKTNVIKNIRQSIRSAKHAR